MWTCKQGQNFKTRIKNWRLRTPWNFFVLHFPVLQIQRPQDLDRWFLALTISSLGLKQHTRKRPQCHFVSRILAFFSGLASRPKFRAERDPYLNYLTMMKLQDKTKSVIYETVNGFWLNFMQRWGVAQGGIHYVLVARCGFFRGSRVIFQDWVETQLAARKLTFCSVCQQVMNWFWWDFLEGRPKFKHLYFGGNQDQDPHPGFLRSPNKDPNPEIFH